ncbi:glycosyl hydrolase 53 family protein [Mucilaginibacter sp. JRF]|uniref:glycosyl hydrolase 53 family protein n=1 Tax=Mucilaginibacter sp. JRF TaxID=2780088 RepID=UPI001881A00E|nr:glycosyl hydrolase 53 family protein [Mucilaginibacter sp. JRF]MBE9585873.1 glycosyl hydrolase 53 family protein [Mucilaginibacter sp. JRF]
MATIRAWIFILCICLGGAANAQRNSKIPFLWGVNGHPLTQKAYTKNLDQQISDILNLGVKCYRFDILTDAQGYAKREQGLQTLLKKLKDNNIRPLPVVMQSGLKGLSVDSIYSVSFTQGKNFAQRYGSTIDVFEVGNEEDNKMMNKGNPRGTKAADFNLPKAERLITAIKGFIDGFKSVKPTAKTTLSVSYIHYYYLQLLQDYKVNYDIIGAHWYSNMGNIKSAKVNGDDVLAVMRKRFNKTIWVTEYNYSRGTLRVDADKHCDYLKSSLSEVYNQGLADALFVYELYDQPELQPRYPDEAFYGLMSDGADGKHIPKAGYDGYKQLIKELK